MLNFYIDNFYIDALLLPRVFQRVFFQTKVTTTWSFARLTAYCWLYSCMPGLLLAGSRWCSPEVLQAPRPTERAQQGRAGCVWASCHLCSHLEHAREYFLYCGLKKKIRRRSFYLYLLSSIICCLFSTLKPV